MLDEREREPARILEAMRMNATMAGTSVLVLAQRFGVSGGLPLLAAEITDRALRLAAAGDAEVRKWDAHTEAQRVISSNRASVPDSMARKTGLLMSASWLGPCAMSIA